MAFKRTQFSQQDVDRINLRNKGLVARREEGEKGEVVKVPKINGNRINIKPLSINEAFFGRHVKTTVCRRYEASVYALLPQMKLPEAPYEVRYKFGFSSRGADLANPEKVFTDLLCKRYNFDDRYIFKMTLEKEITKKGNEFIEFEILHYK